MEILENKHNLDVFLENKRKIGYKVALIPTMGGIHEGHMSLVEKAKNLGFFTVVTIFINPTQFNDLKDYDNYPQNKEADISLLKKINTDLLFLPLNKDLYPGEIKSEKTIFDYRNILCDKFRPGHFDGVTTVVRSLFNLVNPDYAFFGEKDYQQLKVIQKIIENDNLPIVVHPCISIRMLNGMSFSSRYTNFNSLQQKIFDNVANKIMNCLLELRKKIDVKILVKLKEDLRKIKIEKVDYLEIRDEYNLLPSKDNKSTRLFIAFYLDNIRIIDNFILY